MKRIAFLLLLLPLLVLGSAASLDAQSASEQEAPLGTFISEVARLWSSGDATALVELAPADGRILLDLGNGASTVQGRHATAALRTLFNERETISTRPSRVTVAGGRPLRGFGELAWSFRPRGVSNAQSAPVFVGTVWDGTSWRIRELRLLR